MTISIELKPEVEECLGREASAKGVSVEAYVEDLIEQKVVRPYDASRIDLAELDRVLDALSEGSQDRPAPLPARESIYQEHN